MTTPFRSRASSRASADLPLAVGPAISSARFGRGIVAVDSVVVFIAAPGSRAIDDGLVQDVTAILGSRPTWLAETEAVQWQLPSSPRMTEVLQRIARKPID